MRPEQQNKLRQGVGLKVPVLASHLPFLRLFWLLAAPLSSPLLDVTHTEDEIKLCLFTLRHSRSMTPEFALRLTVLFVQMCWHIARSHNGARDRGCFTPHADNPFHVPFISFTTVEPFPFCLLFCCLHASYVPQLWMDIKLYYWWAMM